MKRPSELLVVWMLVGACGPHEPASRDGELGAVSLAAVGSAHDVTQVAFSIVEPAGNCTTGPVVASGTIPLHPGALSGHRFGEATFLVPPGSYLACAAPRQNDASPSAECAPASAPVVVTAGETTTASLVSQCVATQGGVDVNVELNDPPRIDDVQVSPSKFIEDCETATLSVDASDPEGAALSYSWAVTAQPVGSTPVLTPAADIATFDADLAGDYTISVVVADPDGASDTVHFPMHVSVGTCTSGGHVEWVLAGGGTNADTMAAVAVAPDGHIFAAGSFGPTIDFGAGPLNAVSGFDAFVLKIAPDGNIVWQQAYGTVGNEDPASVAVDQNGDLYVGGRFGISFDFGCGSQSVVGVDDAFLAKLDGNTGACIWSHAFGGSANDRVTAVAVDPAGNVIMGGHFGSPSMTIPGGNTHASAGNFDLFYASFDANGVHRWDHRAGGTLAEELNDLAVDAAGDIAIVGATRSATLTFDPGITAPPRSSQDLFIGKLSGGTGNMTHLLVPQATGNDRANSVAFDPIGGILVAFELEGTVDFGDGPMTTPASIDVVVTRLSGVNLSHDWSVQANATTWARARHIAVDSAGDVRLLGDFHSGVTFGGMSFTTTQPDDIFVTSLNGINGAAQWTTVGASTVGDDEGSPGLAVDATGATYLAGRFGGSGQTNFLLGDSSTPFTSAGNFDAFIAKVIP
ncbi:MAG: hypothetical protein R3B72_51015 [Polyangiaceae bacterium]